jgi:DNA-binding IclR family transcriptional regulator
MAAEPAPRKAKTYNIGVLQKTLMILDVLLEAHRPLTLVEIVQQTGTPKSTAFRILTNLLRAGYITHSGSGYWLGLKLLSLGSAVEQNLDVYKIAGPHLLQLRDATQETAYLATLTQQMEVIYLDRAPSLQPIAVVLKTVGMTAPLYCTALGKSLAAYLPRETQLSFLDQCDFQALTPNTLTSKEALIHDLDLTRQRGYAVDNMETTASICCIAAPIFNRKDEAVAAISVAGPSERMPRPLVGSDTALLVVETARRISAELGSR